MKLINDLNLTALWTEYKPRVMLWLKNPIYIGIFILFLFSAGSSYYILFASNSASAGNIAASTNTMPVLPTIEPTITPLTMPTATPVASPTATPAVDPTLNWKTFTNVNQGYSIKYPQDWTATDSGQLEDLIPDYVIFNPTTSTTSARTITASYTTRTIAQLNGIYASPSAELTVDGLIGNSYLMRNSDGDMSESIILALPTNFMVFYSVQEYETTLMQMLGTFQLIK